MLMILARLVRSESFWAVVKVRSPHTGPEVCYIIARLSFPPFSSGNLILLSHRCLRLATATSLHNRPATPAVCDPGPSAQD